jgi:hypothetical protein
MYDHSWRLSHGCLHMTTLNVELSFFATAVAVVSSTKPVDARMSCRLCFEHVFE